MVGGSRASPELVFILLSGLITRYASLEKNRTFCPEPGVFRSRRIERTEPYCLYRSVGVWGAGIGADRGAGDVGRVVSTECLLRASSDPTTIHEGLVHEMVT